MKLDTLCKALLAPLEALPPPDPLADGLSGVDPEDVDAPGTLAGDDMTLTVLCETSTSAVPQHWQMQCGVRPQSDHCSQVWKDKSRHRGPPILDNHHFRQCVLTFWLVLATSLLTDDLR